MTLLQLVNKLRRRLRESEVTDLTSDAYSELLVDFINDVAGEMCDTYDWTQLRTDIAFDVTAATASYDLSTYSITNDSKLVMDPRMNQPMIYMFESDTDDVGTPLAQIADEAEFLLKQSNRDGDSDNPVYFTLRNQSGGSPTITFWPTPAANRYVRAKFWVPEAAFDVDTDAATNIRLPERPLFLGALYLALNERGEEMGEPGNIAERRYNVAMNQAVFTDAQQRIVTNEYEAWRD